MTKKKQDEITEDEKEIQELYDDIKEHQIFMFKETFNSKTKFVKLNNTSSEILLKAKIRKEHIDRKNKGEL